MRLVGKHWFAREYGNNLENYTKKKKKYHVNFRMAKKPEQMLPAGVYHHRRRAHKRWYPGSDPTGARSHRRWLSQPITSKTTATIFCIHTNTGRRMRAVLGARRIDTHSSKNLCRRVGMRRTRGPSPSNFLPCRSRRRYIRSYSKLWDIHLPPGSGCAARDEKQHGQDDRSQCENPHN